MIGDQKVNRIIVPPIRVTDVPYCNTATDFKADRLYKLQFQAPPQVGSYGFQVHFVSDSFLWDDIRRNVTVSTKKADVLVTVLMGSRTARGRGLLCATCG